MLKATHSWDDQIGQESHGVQRPVSQSPWNVKLDTGLVRG